MIDCRYCHSPLDSIRIAKGFRSCPGCAKRGGKKPPKRKAAAAATRKEIAERTAEVRRRRNEGNPIGANQ